MSSEIDVLREASRHILLAGGKRVRPRLLFLAYQAVGGDDLTSAVTPAAALEILHTATLAHDDINDHGVLRRDRPTINAIWGRTFALLTGDYLFAKVYEMLAPYGAGLNAALAEAVVQVVEGETLQAQAAKAGALDEPTYYRIIALKTAALFRAAARVGAQLGDGAPGQVELLGDYGFKIGLAFQIIDDILDLLADSAQLGKSAGLDMAQGKGIAVAVGGDGSVATMVAPAGVQVDERDPLLAFKQQVLQGDTVGRARRQARRLVEDAVAMLDALPLSEAVDALKALARSVVERDR
ncbi:MAG: polyprenyl synthetase family protein [Anaerolineae bacterium]|nr:polyprenyl synthetase family protein [Anaerolineae bacterium]